MRRSLPVVVCVLLSAATAAGPAERTHVVAEGESASAIARRYYGDFSLTDLLLEFNGRGGSVLHPGETLRIPDSPVHAVRRGDSWSAIAERYLGRASAWRAVAALNGFENGSTLRVGQHVVVPVVLDYRLGRGESLAVLAERFYGEVSRARLLAEFNGIDDPRRLSVGQSLDIPLTDFRLAKQPAPAPVPTPPADAEDPGMASTLVSATEAWRRGEYGRARGLLEAVESVSGSRAQRARYWRLLAFVYVAFDADERACGAWSELEPEQAATRLDPDRVSPKIREALAACSS